MLFSKTTNFVEAFHEKLYLVLVFRFLFSVGTVIFDFAFVIETNRKHELSAKFSEKLNEHCVPYGDVKKLLFKLATPDATEMGDERISLKLNFQRNSYCEHLSTNDAALLMSHVCPILFTFNVEIINYSEGISERNV